MQTRDHPLVIGPREFGSPTARKALATAPRPLLRNRTVASEAAAISNAYSHGPAGPSTYPAVYVRYVEEAFSPFLSALAEHADFGIDVAFLDVDGRYLLVSNGIARWNGISMKDHVGLHPRDVRPEVWRQLEPYFARARDGEAVTFEVTYEEQRPEPLPADGTGPAGHVLMVRAFPVYAPGPTLLAVGLSCADVTELRAGEAALLAARRRAAVGDLAERALAGAATIQELCDTAAGAVATTLEVPIARVVQAVPGSNVLQLRGGVGSAWDAVRAGPRPGSYVQYVMDAGGPVTIDDLASEQRFRPPRTLLELGVRSSLGVAVRNSRGPWGMLSAHSFRPRHFTQDEAAFVRDVAGVLSLAVQAQEAMAFQKELISIASHELRTPLTTIIGMGQRLERTLQRKLPDDEAAELAHVVVDEGLRLNAMIDRWMGVTEVQTRGAARRREPVELLAHVARQVALARDRHPALQIAEHYPQQPLELFTDGDAVSEILDNLLENAARHAGPSAHVDVTVERCDEGHIAIDVADDGPGIPPDTLKHVFERFYRGDPSRGLGVGLYVSRALAEELGGTLEVESEPGCGARFTLTLPC